MKWFRRAASGSAGVLILWVSIAVTAGQAPPSATIPVVSCPEMETFLETAKVTDKRTIPVGVTMPSRATLDDGRLRHDAAIQMTDVRKPTFQTNRGTELNFRDAWQFNVAGYELAKILGLNMVPPYVERRLSGGPASVSWWVNEAMMDRDRVQKKIKPPDLDRWNQEMYAIRVFRELIGDVDLNQTNLLITKDWRLWMIDFSRAFRLTKTLHDPKGLVMIDRRLLENLRGLRTDVLQQAIGRWAGKSEIQAILARRDLIVQHFEAAIARQGEGAILYDFARTSEPCGAGLN